MLDGYVKAILGHGVFEPGIYQGYELTKMVLELPWRGGDVEMAPRLVEDIPIDRWARQTFFAACQTGDISLMTTPFRVSKALLTSLESLPDWKTLYDYLRTFGLEPSIVFRNEPVMVGRNEYYVGDFRMVFVGGGSEHRYDG